MGVDESSVLEYAGIRRVVNHTITSISDVALLAQLDGVQTDERRGGASDGRPVSFPDHAPAFQVALVDVADDMVKTLGSRPRCSGKGLAGLLPHNGRPNVLRGPVGTFARLPHFDGGEGCGQRSHSHEHVGRIPPRRIEWRRNHWSIADPLRPDLNHPLEVRAQPKRESPIASGKRAG